MAITDTDAGTNLNDDHPLALLPAGARRVMAATEVHRGPISARLGKISQEIDTIERVLGDLRKAIEDIKALL
jgi:hypothetical protein